MDPPDGKRKRPMGKDEVMLVTEDLPFEERRLIDRNLVEKGCGTHAFVGMTKSDLNKTRVQNSSKRPKKYHCQPTATCKTHSDVFSRNFDQATGLSPTDQCTKYCPLHYKGRLQIKDIRRIQIDEGIFSLNPNDSGYLSETSGGSDLEYEDEDASEQKYADGK